MARRPLVRRGRFRLIDLFVLIAIVAVLCAAGIPLLRQRQTHGSEMECMHNMRNVAAALNIYEMTHRHYPGYTNVLRLNNGPTYVDPATGQPRGVSFVVPLFSYLDLALLERIWKTPGRTLPVVGAPGRAQTIDARIELALLRCPSAPRKPSEKCPLSYVVNCGMPDIAGVAGTPAKSGTPRDWAANGVFFDHYTGTALPVPAKTPPVYSDELGIYSGRHPGIPQVGMSADYISRADGIGQTCLLSENADAGQYTDDTEAKVGIIWDVAAGAAVDLRPDPPHIDPPNDKLRINVGKGDSMPKFWGSQPGTDLPRPSSFHHGGVNMAFCDGKVRFVSDTMDYFVYCLLMSTNGAKVKRPGSNQVLPNFNRPIDENWYLK
jgi:hypothetical protein